MVYEETDESFYITISRSRSDKLLLIHACALSLTCLLLLGDFRLQRSAGSNRVCYFCTSRCFSSPDACRRYMHSVS